MSVGNIRIKYDGGDADNHTIDLRLLGESLAGADRVISDGLILFLNGRLAKRGERYPVITKVGEPTAGSWELWALWEAVAGTLPLGLPSAMDLANHFMGEWWKAVIAKFSGQTAQSEKAIEAMLELMRMAHEARNASEERAHELQMMQAATIREALQAQGRAIEAFARPVGPSCDRAYFMAGERNQALLTSDDAAAIRDSQRLEWGPIEEVELRTDGFKFHTNGLSVENPEKEGFLMARVHDPAFEKEENPYTEAAQRRSRIVVTARKGYRGKDLSAIDILDFVREIAA